VAQAETHGGPEGQIQALIGLFVLFVGTKIGDELARRAGQPAVVGELVGGFVVGPHALGLMTPDAAALVMAELGVVILLFQVGLEVRVGDLLAVGKMAVATAVIAIILPIAGGALVMSAYGASAATAWFVGLALAATSIGVTSKVLADMRVLDRPFARVVLGAAVIDDVLALLSIGLITGMADGPASAVRLVPAAFAIGLVLLGFAMARRARGLKREVSSHGRSSRIRRSCRPSSRCWAWR
jgi:Kef-type K+ transport system membrane component KefB